MAEAQAPSKAGGGTGLNKRLGPLPLWMWALIGGGGIAAVLYIRSKGKQTPASSQECPSGQLDANGDCVSSIDQTQLAIVPVPTPAGTPAPTPANPSAGVSGYVVKKGDTWGKIARKLGTTPQDLFYYQFSDAGQHKNTQQFRTKIAEFGPNSIIAGNLIAYPSNGVYPQYTPGFKYHTSKDSFWIGGKDKTKAKPVK